MNMKRIIVFIAVIGVLIAAFFVIQEILLSGIEVGEDEIKGYAAAFATLEQNQDKNEEKLMETAESYLKKKSFYGSNELSRRILDGIYGIEELPPVYESVPALKSGIEESLTVLADYDSLMEGKTEPEMKDYTTEDFYRLLNERIAAEEDVLDALNSDPDPDLFLYASKLYQAREDHPVIY